MHNSFIESLNAEQTLFSKKNIGEIVYESNEQVNIEQVMNKVMFSKKYVAVSIKNKNSALQNLRSQRLDVFDKKHLRKS